MRAPAAPREIGPVIEGGVSHFEQSLHAVLADPRLRPAMVAYAEGFTRLYGEPRAVAIMGDLGRFAIIAGLFARSGPVTQAAILDEMGPDLAGRARVASHLRMLADTGALSLDDGEGRARLVRPTPWLEDWMGRWLLAMILPARPWWQGDGSATEPPEASDAMLASYLGQVLSANRSGLTAFGSTPGVWRMLSLVGGHLLLLELVLASQGATLIGEPLTFSRRAFAARYDVSRAHAVDLITEAGRLGWLERRDDAVVLSPAFAEEARRWCAIHFLLCNATLAGRLLDAMQAAAMTTRPQRV